MTSLPTPWMPQDTAKIDFKVLRKGKPFGRHILEFKRQEDGSLSVITDVDLEVKVGPFTAFRYRLDSEETWRDGQLVALKGASNNDGRKGKVAATLNGGALVIDSTEFDGTLPASTIPSSHWNILQVFSERMLSTETGEVIDIDVETLGPDTVMVAGSPVDATHYRLKSDITVDLWYDAQNRWVKLTFEARGQTIEYQLTALYS